MTSHHQAIRVAGLLMALLVGLACGAALGQAGAVQFSESLFAAGEASGTARIELRRSGGTFGAVSVTFSTSAGSATAGAEDRKSVV